MKVLKNIKSLLILTLSLSLIHCGGSSSSTGLISSDTMIQVHMSAASGQLEVLSLGAINLEQPQTITPRFSGDHLIAVMDQFGNLQSVEFFSVDPNQWVRVVDPFTGKSSRQLQELNPSFVVQLAINENSDRIIVVSPQQETLLEVPVDWEFWKFSQQVQDSKSLAKPFSLPPYFWIHWNYAEDFAGTGMSFLDNSDYEALLAEAINLIPTDGPLASLRELQVVRDLDVDGVPLAGAYLNQTIYLREEFFLGPKNDFLEVFFHEVAHSYLQAIDGTEHGIGLGFQDTFPELTDIYATYSQRREEVLSGWADLQSSHRQIRSQSVCADEFIESAFDYWTSEEGELESFPTVDDFFKNGFATPYGSTHVEEDLAETYAMVLVYPELFAAKVAPGNVYQQKLNYLVELGMLPPAFYDSIIEQAASLVEQDGLVAFSFTYKGVQFHPLNFTLNGEILEPPFFGVGESIISLPRESVDLLGGNLLSLSTVEDEDGDFDDIEVDSLLVQIMFAPSADNACDASQVLLDAPEPVHLGNDDCPNDIFCSSYSELVGIAAAWPF